MNTTDFKMNMENFSIVVGDIHSSGTEFLEIERIVRHYGFPLILLGDLVDRGSTPGVLFESLKRLHDENLIEAMVVGNHDHKLYRHLKGNKVKLSHGAESTAEFFRENPHHADFYKNLVESSYLMYRRGNHIFVHAAANKYHLKEDVQSLRYMDFLEKKMDRRGAEVYLYGYTTGEYKDGFPVRLMDWMDHVPVGVRVYKGHDFLYDEVVVNTNEQGGHVVFMDTGCGHLGGKLSYKIITY